MGTNPFRSLPPAGDTPFARKTPEEIRSEMNAMREEVKDDIRRRFAKDTNPVTQFLLKVGVLEDMEVLRRLIMTTGDGKMVYHYTKKLESLKTYMALAKDAVAMQEKQIKVDAAVGAAASVDGDDEVKITLIR